MKFETRLYKYDSSQESNGYRGQDFSKHILQGDSDVDDLTEILDVVNLTLVDLPFSQEFSPLSKFIYEKWQYIESGTAKAVNRASKVEKELVMWKDWHLCVAEDVVSQPVVTDDTKFDHTITFNEASVDAQKRIVDNIAVTYKLQDVTLEEKPTYEIDEPAKKDYISYDFIPKKDWDLSSGGMYSYFGHKFTWEWMLPAMDWANFKYNQVLGEGEYTKNITIFVPSLVCNMPNGSKDFRQQGKCSVYVVVEATSIENSEVNQTVHTQRIDAPPIDNDLEISPLDRWETSYQISGTNQINDLPVGYIINRIMNYPAGGSSTTIYVKKVAEFSENNANPIIRFDVQVGYRYTVKVTPYDFKTNEIGGNGDLVNLPSWYMSDDTVPICGQFESNQVDWSNPTVDYITTQKPIAQLTFECVSSETYKTISIRSASPCNAYDLYNKAILTTQNYKKQPGVIIDETPKAYYLEAQDKERLSNTQIVENFYNQKNWWELQLDIGKYIHAIPKVRFGSDDRFVTTWQQLGDTNKRQDSGKKISIYNSKNIDNYIAGVSSYVSNIVQLGGIIDEWVAPKSSSDDYLVYNDVAEIHTTRNIIEIVDFEIKRLSDNQVRNLAGKGTQGESMNGYIFAYEIYKTLGLKANKTPNKGIAVYYQLGTNKIQGLSYRLPTYENYDKTDSEYSIKRIIGDAFGIPYGSDTEKIKINDFIFHIVYRTKDTLRTDQVRPDLRKFLMTSKHDRIPQAHQFNNQTDTVVDSVKFGNNTYGMLIRTGNTTYKVTEWHDSLFTIKNAGELYEIKGEWLYVSKVQNTYYANHIVSEVEFSKDFNRLSQIIGIPSEPRFYEISEQSQIKREIALNDYIVIDTDIVSLDNQDSYVQKVGWEWIKNILFGETKDYPKYAITILKNDIEKQNIAGNQHWYKELCHSIGAYSIQNILTLSWGMEDNFSAGAIVEPTTASLDEFGSVDGAYSTLEQVRYTDIFGRGDLLEFCIINQFDIPPNLVAKLPNNPIALVDNASEYIFGSCDTSNVGSHYHGIGLLKDNRENLHFNYNLQVITNSDRFVLSAYMWQTSKQNLKLALLSKEVNKISVSTIQEYTILTTVDFTTSFANSVKGGIKINIRTALASVLNTILDKVASIAIISNNKINDVENSGEKYFILARNVSDLPNSEKIADWYVSHIDKSMFDKQ